MGIYASSFNQSKVSQLIQKFDQTIIVFCILGICKLSFLSNLKTNISYSALLLIDTNSDVSDENRGNGILIEFGDYSPNMSETERRFMNKGIVIYPYGIKGGLRYYIKNYSEFLKEFGNIGYINMDIDLK